MPEAILLQDVENLGEKGTVVDVSKGYLRNFLIPRKLAQPASKGLLEQAKQRNRGKPTRRRDKKGGPGSGRRKPCPYCKEKIEQADYKDTATLRKFISEKGKIRSRRITGACRRHQSQIARAVKRARELALLPYVNEGGRDDADRERGGRRGRDDR